MGKISFDVNNGGKMELTQTKHDREVIIKLPESETIISNGDFVMLINLYKYIKSNDIQNDFINYWGKNKQ